MKVSTTGLDNQQYLDGLLNQDVGVLNRIYQSYFTGIVKYIKEHGGHQEDAEDIFQDALIVVYRQLKAGRLQLTSSFHTYLFAVCKRIWLKKSSVANRRKQLLDQQPKSDIKSPPVESEIIQTEKYKLYQEKFAQLSEDCQKVLEMFFSGNDMKKIAAEMGYSSEGYAKKRKFKCKQKLTQLIKSDPRFNEINEEA